MGQLSTANWTRLSTLSSTTIYHYRESLSHPANPWPSDYEFGALPTDNDKVVVFVVVVVVAVVVDDDDDDDDDDDYDDDDDDDDDDVVVAAAASAVVVVSVHFQNMSVMYVSFGRLFTFA